MRMHSILQTALLCSIVTSWVWTTALVAQPTDSPARADSLFNQAAAMQERAGTPFPLHLRRTAKLYVKSARLRDDSDPRKVESLYRAGAMLVAVDPALGRKLLVEAAESALTYGDVARAAHLYLDCAWIVHVGLARSLEAQQTANQCLERAYILAQVPFLSTNERNSIMARVQLPSTEFSRPNDLRT